MQTKKPNLIFITSKFPVDTSGEFLSHALPFLATRFKIRIVSTTPGGNLSRPLPPEVRFTRMPPLSKAKRFLLTGKVIFSKKFFTQLKELRKSKKLTAKKYWGTLHTLALGRHLSDYLSDLGEFNSPDPLMIYSFLSHRYVYGSVLAKEFRKAPTKLVISCRTVDYFRFTHGDYLDGAIKDINEKSDIIQFDSKNNMNDFVKEFSLNTYDHSKYQLVHFGVSECNVSTVRNDDIQTLNIITHTQQGTNDGLYLFVNALSNIHTGHIHWTHICMRKEDLDLKRHVNRQLIRNPHVTCTFTPIMKGKERVKFYSENPIHCVMNLNSIIPFEFIECMSLGIMPIAIDVGGASEFVNDQNGLLLPADITAEKLSNVISLAISLDRKAIREKGEMAVQFYRENFLATDNYKKLTLDLYSEIVSMQTESTEELQPDSSHEQVC